MNFLKSNSFFDLCVSEVCLSQGNAEDTIKMLYNCEFNMHFKYLLDISGTHVF